MSESDNRSKFTTLEPNNISEENTETFNYIKEDSNERSFNGVIGYIEEIIMDKEFLKILTDFMENNWMHFENSEENKLIYSDIFCSYQNTIEKFIENKLSEKMEDFDMRKFEDELIERKGELDGEIFEILSTFTDFLEFKQMFLDYKMTKDGSGIDFSNDFTIRKYKTTTEN